jgi:hypothetical protein
MQPLACIMPLSDIRLMLFWSTALTKTKQISNIGCNELQGGAVIKYELKSTPKLIQVKFLKKLYELQKILGSHDGNYKQYGLLGRNTAAW